MKTFAERLKETVGAIRAPRRPKGYAKTKAVMKEFINAIKSHVNNKDVIVSAVLHLSADNEESYDITIKHKTWCNNYRLVKIIMPKKHLPARVDRILESDHEYAHGSQTYCENIGAFRKVLLDTISSKEFGRIIHIHKNAKKLYGV